MQLVTPERYNLISLKARILKADHYNMTPMPGDYMDRYNPSKLEFSVPGIIVVGVVYIVKIVDVAFSRKWLVAGFFLCAMMSAVFVVVFVVVVAVVGVVVAAVVDAWIGTIPLQRSSLRQSGSMEEKNDKPLLLTSCDCIAVSSTIKNVMLRS